MARLGDIATVITKGTTPTSIGFNFQNDGINFVKIESVDENGSFICEKFDHISDECHEKLKRSQLQENDILFSIAGAIGRTAIVTKDILPANTNQALAIIRIPQGVINYSFLLYILQSSVVLDQAEKKKQGVAQLNLSLKDIGDFIIPDIPLEEQQCIVDSLDKVSNLISLRKQQLAKLDELVKSRFVELFGGEKYAKKPIRELVDRKIASARKTYGCDDTIHYIDISSIDNKANVVTGTTEYIMADAPSRAQQCIQYGDILISTVRPNLRNIARNDYSGDKYVASSGFCVLRAKNCDTRFLLCAVLADDFTNAMTEVTTGANYPAIKDSDVLGYRIPVPSIELQKQFAAFVEQIDKSKLEIQKSLNQLETLKKALMQKYFG